MIEKIRKINNVLQENEITLIKDNGNFRDMTSEVANLIDLQHIVINHYDYDIIKNWNKLVSSETLDYDTEKGQEYLIKIHESLLYELKEKLIEKEKEKARKQKQLDEITGE